MMYSPALPETEKAMNTVPHERYSYPLDTVLRSDDEEGGEAGGGGIQKEGGQADGGEVGVVHATAISLFFYMLSSWYCAELYIKLFRIGMIS